MPSAKTRPSKKSKTPKSKLQVLQSDTLKLPWLVHGFSTRTGGSSTNYGGGALNLGFTERDSPKIVEHDREAFLRKLGVDAPGFKLITLRQIHSDIIHVVEDAPSDVLTGDGLVTNTTGLLLGIQTADCLPVLLVDTKRRVVGAFHAGWRGTLARIVKKGVGDMQRHFGTSPRDLKAGIGPGIHACCYEVGQELREKFHSQFSYADDLFRELRDSDPVREKYPLLFMNARAPGHGPDIPKIFLDLVAANTRQLLDAGLLAKNIQSLPLCTSCRTDLLFSYRAEKGSTGRLMAVIGLRP